MKTVLIIASIILVLGGILIGVGYLILQKYPVEMNTVKDSVYKYSIENLPQEINVTTLDSRVEFLPIDGEEWRVECKDTEQLYHTVELVDGVLTVKQTGTLRKWYEYIGVLSGSFETLSVIVYLPEQAYTALGVYSTSGSIKVRENFIFENASLQSTSGSILCNARVLGVLDVKNTSGSITVGGFEGGDLTVKNTSGSIHILGGVNGNLDVTNVSGSIEIKDAVPVSVTVRNTSGSIDLINVICTEACNIENGSGSIELKRCDAASFDLKSISGGIHASILSAKTFDCHSTGGGVHAPQNGEGGTFKAKTVSGGIRITVTE